MSRDIAVGLQLSGSQLVLVVGVGVRKGEKRLRGSGWVGQGGEAVALLAVGGRQAGRRMVALGRWRHVGTDLHKDLYITLFHFFIPKNQVKTRVKHLFH